MKLLAAVLAAIVLGACSSAPAGRADAAPSAVIMAEGGAVGALDEDATSGPIEILRVRVHQGGGALRGFYASPGGSYRVVPGEEVELWIEWASRTVLAEPPRLVVEWGNGAADNIHCGPCKLSTRYPAGVYIVVLRMDDRAGGVTTRTFTLDARPESAGGIETRVFASPSPIQLPYSATCAPQQAIPYPVTILVSGLSGRISKVTVTLSGLTTDNGNMLALLVAPDGKTVKLLDEAGGTTSDLDVTFEDGAPGFGGGLMGPGPLTVRPSQTTNDSPLLAPAPNVTDGLTLGTLSGSDPNGTWRLFMQSHLMCANGMGQIARGWSLAISTVSE